MAINIKDRETDALARELSTLTGESITVAVRIAMQERVDRLHAGRRASRADLQRYIERARSRPILDNRSEDEIFGWDENGLPQ